MSAICFPLRCCTSVPAYFADFSSAERCSRNVISCGVKSSNFKKCLFLKLKLITHFLLGDLPQQQEIRPQEAQQEHPSDKGEGKCDEGHNDQQHGQEDDGCSFAPIQVMDRHDHEHVQEQSIAKDHETEPLTEGEEKQQAAEKTQGYLEQQSSRELGQECSLSPSCSGQDVEQS